MNLSEYGQYDGLGLAELVRKGEVTAAELTELALAAIDQLNPELNAVWNVLGEQARESAKAASDGPFAGVPFVVKEEVCHMAGVPLSQGCRLAADISVPYDTELMARFRKAGVIPVGTTTLPALGFSPTAESVFYGATHNPWRKGHIAGGSSGGTGAAVAAGITPIGYGNDGGGSIRIPAANCGLVGMKPTRGRLPTGPDNGELLSGLGVEGVLTRSLRDTAAMLDAVSGPDAGAYAWAQPPARPYQEEIATAPGKLRIAWMQEPLTGEAVDPETIAILHDTVKLCEELGHEVVEASPDIDSDAHMEATLKVWSANMAHSANILSAMTGREVSRDTLEAATLACRDYGLTLSATSLLEAQGVFTEVSRSVGRFFQQYDVLLSPVCSVPPPRHGVINQNKAGITPREWIDTIFGYAAFTGLQNTTGQPAISLPLGWTSDNLPIGMQFAGRFADEATLFRLAGQIERARPWVDRHPPLYVGAV